jgi:outer membrane protein assembly factor BamB
MKKALRVSFFAAACALVLTACGGELPPSSFPGLSLDGSTAYLASNAHVYKFDAATGAEAWRFPASGAQPANGERLPGPFAGPPLKFGDLIIVGGTIGTTGEPDRNVYAISDQNGQEVWRFSAGQTSREYVDGVATDGKLIFAPNGDNVLYALDPSQMNGAQPRLAWTFTGSTNKLWTRPLVADGKIYLPSLDHHLFALDAATGKELWRFQADASIASRPALKDGVLYVGSFDRKFYAVNAETGDQIWETEGLLEGWVWNDATVDPDRDIVYVGDVKGKFYAIDTESGKIVWSSQLGGAIHGQSVINGNRIYVVSFDTHVYSIERGGAPDANGNMPFRRVLETGLGRRLASTPTVLEGALLVPLFDGEIRLTALDLETGAKKYEFPPRPAQ